MLCALLQDIQLVRINAKRVAKVIIVVHRHALAMVLYIYGRGESAWHEFVL